jgi:hypothetical protein
MSLSPSLFEPVFHRYHCCSRDLSLMLGTTTMFPSLPRAPQATSVYLDLNGNGLPNEILGAIFDYLSPDALTRVALVSRRWRANAERVLYSTIILHEVLPRASPAFASATAAGPAAEQELKDFQTTTTTMPAVPITTLRCCETLSAHPHLAEYVRRFHLRWDTDAVESPLFLLRIAHHIARTLVPTLVHLDSLELSFDLAPHFLESANDAPPQIPLSLPSPSPSPPSPHTRKHHSTEQQQQQLHQHQLHLLLLPPICLPSLRTLALRGIGTPPSHELEHILHNHPKLLHLRLSDYHRALHLSPTDVPHLRSFRGYPATAASILPGRPVQALGLVGCESATEEDLARIAAGSIPVRALDLSGMSVTPTLLRSVSRHLSHVEWLKVRLALRHTLHYAFSGIVRHASGPFLFTLTFFVLTDPDALFFFSFGFSVPNNKKAAFDGAYNRPRGFSQPTRPRSLVDKRRNTACYRISRRRQVRWTAAAAERCGRTAPVYRLDGRVPSSATRRVPVSNGVVTLRSRHVDFRVWIRVTFQVSRLSSSSLLPRCVAVILYVQPA